MPADPVIANEHLPIDESNRKARLHKHNQFVSRLTSERHDVLVYLPTTYEAESERHFPVLYMNDGQNLFDPETSYIPGNYWRLGETADALTRAGAIEPLIIVGIYNAGLKRIDEYTPVADRRLGGGQADAYGRMLVEELKPFIDTQYRTLPSPDHCGLGGSSLGGLVTLYLGLRYPEVFRMLAVVSPSIWWRSRAILKTVAALKQKPATRIWLDMGTNETSKAISDARALRDHLLKKGWRLGEDLAYLEVEGAQHTESAWAERVEPILRFLFPVP